MFMHAFIKETREKYFLQVNPWEIQNLFLYYGMILFEESVNTLTFDVEVHHIFEVQEFQASTEVPSQCPYCTLL